MSATSIVVLALYLALMIGVAAWFSRRSAIRDGGDFIMAGRSLPTFVLGGTLLATFVGSGSIIGGANFVFTNGPLAGIFFFLGTFAAIIVLGFMSRRIRESSFNTVPELLRERYGPATGVIGTVLVLVAFIGIGAYQFTGTGYILSLITPLSEVQGTIIALVLICFLAVSGGLKSVAWTDFLSSALVVLGLGSALVWIFAADFGGIGGYVDQLDPAFRSVTGVLGPLQILGYFLPLFLLILGDQNMHQRIGAAKDAATAFRAILVFFVGALLVVGPIILLASSASILNPGSGPDMAILGLAAGGFVPETLGAVILVAALAIIVTTGSSYLLTCSGNVVYDLVFRPGGRRQREAAADPERARRQEVLISRLSVAGVAVLGYVMVQFFPSLLALQMYAYTMYGAAITPVVIAALFWKRASAAGAIASMIAAGAATVAWEVFGPVEEVASVVVALPISVVVLAAVSLAVPQRARERQGVRVE
ncbi:sodium:solute symporter family protein [Brevibacterium album]|uniref:sodium:solute symporter family protein n=1 Tax=Brevibacterium album TaxID=417948 RepID=UPI0004028B34|nr:sodium:solute symporter family protein [Brevibacterium album]